MRAKKIRAERRGRVMREEMGRVLLESLYCVQRFNARAAKLPI